MEILPGTVLEKDRVVPGTPMTEASSGAEVSMWDFRQRFSVAVCFLHDRCEACAGYAQKLAGLEGDLRDVDARAIVVLSEPGVLDLPVWVDGRARARQRFLGPAAELPVILIVDRYVAALRSFHLGAMPSRSRERWWRRCVTSPSSVPSAAFRSGERAVPPMTG
jgi:hypothetical protein